MLYVGFYSKPKPVREAVTKMSNKHVNKTMADALNSFKEAGQAGRNWAKNVVENIMETKPKKLTVKQAVASAILGYDMVDIFSRGVPNFTIERAHKKHQMSGTRLLRMLKAEFNLQYPNQKAYKFYGHEYHIFFNFYRWLQANYGE